MVDIQNKTLTGSGIEVGWGSLQANNIFEDRWARIKSWNRDSGQQTRRRLT